MARLRNLNLREFITIYYAGYTFKPILSKHDSLENLRALPISHALMELILVRFCLLSSKNDKVSESQSSPVSIH